MGYLWDIIKAFLAAVLILTIAYWITGENWSETDPFWYWTIWAISLLGAIGGFVQRYEKNRRRRIIENNEYEQASAATKRRKPPPEESTPRSPRTRG